MSEIEQRYKITDRTYPAFKKALLMLCRFKEVYELKDSNTIASFENGREKMGYYSFPNFSDFSQLMEYLRNHGYFKGIWWVYINYPLKESEKRDQELDSFTLNLFLTLLYCNTIVRGQYNEIKNAFFDVITNDLEPELESLIETEKYREMFLNSLSQLPLDFDFGYV